MVLLEWRILSQPCPFQQSGDDGHFDSVASADSVDSRQPISWYCWCTKSQTTAWDLQKNLVNNGITTHLNMVSWSPNFRTINVNRTVSSLRSKGRSLAIRGWQALGPHRASFAGGATVHVTSGYVPDRLQVRLDRRSTTTRHKNLRQRCGVWSEIYSFGVFLMFFVVFRKLLFCNINPIFVSKCSNRIICVSLDGVLTSTFTTGMTWTFFPEAHPALTCPVKKNNSHVPWVRLVG